MKDKKTLMIIIFVFIGVVLISFAVYFSLKTIYKKESFKSQSVINNNIEDKLIDNKLKITKGKIEKNGEIYNITMTVTNDTRRDIDATIYRISLKDSNDKEIEFFSGSVIGVVPAKDKVNISIESYADLTDLKNIEYEEFYQN